MKCLLLPLVTAFAIAPAGAASGHDEILKIANASGCMACHQVEKDPQGPPGLSPIAPAWRDIAARYKSVKGAQQQLTATVMTGSSPSSTGTSPYKNHWEGSVSGPYMPSHRSAITEPDAARLIAWILALDASR
ncbi:MAG: c-type cytochrome [Hydrogenophaga sp.]|nr:c-type cytochrome [Hydrogenophaga sp.]